jgi:hypothetical protein
MPVLNEIDGLRVILPKIDRRWFDQMLMVDGGSRDGSLEYAQSQGVETYVHQKRGIRHAYIEAWPLIRSDSVITFSPDGNCPVGALPVLTEALQKPIRSDLPCEPRIQGRPPRVGPERCRGSIWVS